MIYTQTLSVGRPAGSGQIEGNYYNFLANQPNAAPVFAPYDSTEWPNLQVYEILSIKYVFTQRASSGLWYWFKDDEDDESTQLPGKNTSSGPPDVELEIDVPSEFWNDPYPESPYNSSLAIVFRPMKRNDQTISKNSKWLKDVRIEITYQEKASASQAVVDQTIIGEPQIVHISNDSSVVCHKVMWTYGEHEEVTSGWLSFAAQQRDVQWAVPQGYIDTVCQMATSSQTTVGGKVYVKTYLDNSYQTQIGETQDVQTQLTMSAQQGSPVLSVTLQEVHTGTKPAEDTDYVQSFQTLRVTTSVALKYGASIQSVTVSTPYGNYNPSFSQYTIEPIQIPPQTPLSTSGTFAVIVSLRDSRGFVSSYNTSINILPYTVPTFLYVDCYKTADAILTTEDDEGGYLYVNCSVVKDNHASGDNRVVSVVVKELGQQAQVLQGSISIVFDGNNGTASGHIGNGVYLLDKEKTYTVSLQMTDSYNRSSSYTATILPALYTIHRQSGGRGVAFGKISELYGVEISENWPFYVHGEEIKQLILDYSHPVGSVIESVQSFNPNELWPWSLWGKVSTETKNTSPSLAVNVWVRQK